MSSFIWVAFSKLSFGFLSEWKNESPLREYFSRAIKVILPKTIFDFPLQTDTSIDQLVEIFLKISIKTVQVHLIIGTTLII